MDQSQAPGGALGEGSPIDSPPLSRPGIRFPDPHYGSGFSAEFKEY